MVCLMIACNIGPVGMEFKSNMEGFDNTFNIKILKLFRISYSIFFHQFYYYVEIMT